MQVHVIVPIVWDRAGIHPWDWCQWSWFRCPGTWGTCPCASCTLDPYYGITELETLALVWAVKYFRPYILGHRTTVYTDHAACTSLLNSPRLSGCHTRDESGHQAYCVHLSSRKLILHGNFAGHFAFKKVYDCIRRYYWWHDVHRYCRACLVCAISMG